MPHPDRRGFLAASAVVVGAGTAGTLTTAPASAATAPGAAGPKILPSDARYPSLRTGINRRYAADPEHVKMVRSARDAEDALREAIARRKRISVRSGGHCLADFTCNPEVEVLLDFSEMTGVGYDERRRAFHVEPGAHLMAVYEALYKGWGVTLPGGVCHSVGAGGHISGGGYGLLSRDFGLVVDHLYAVEVVVPGAGGRPRTIVATREADDPHRELWWAHTGGGGGNFGLVTRYWFRTPGTGHAPPERQLPVPPATLHACAIDLSWDELTEDRFVRLLRNYGSWHERNSGPGSPGRHLSTLFNANARRFGSLAHYAQSSSRATLDAYLAALLDGTGLTPRPVDRPSGELAAMPNLFTPRELPWLDAARMVGSPNPVWANPLARVGLKSAYHRRGFTLHQLQAAYRHLSRTDNPDTSLVLLSFGGAINAHGEADTAAAQRDSVFKVLYQSIWSAPQDDEPETNRLRAFYGDVYAETGGVPATGGVTDGCYINYPDTDLADPAVNTSGIPWHELFYKGNYERLRAVKRRYDPHAVLRHKLSVAP
ncbi:FAD-linked oxidase [Streptomyces venezuelae]|uniref:FAD-linked oxidase n=1 Tax=Streptomyces venezuelae TaxID=54571 RepID=A0A5P2DJ63_STRVZ|nr:FAD-binding protein [Streptomyces venezuelae]QES54218.1 FAD-linked oxidase [Streptomyces venezuelae]